MTTQEPVRRLLTAEGLKYLRRITPQHSHAGTIQSSLLDEASANITVVWVIEDEAPCGQITETVTIDLSDITECRERADGAIVLTGSGVQYTLGGPDSQPAAGIAQRLRD